jgi:hypothetical protein
VLDSLRGAVSPFEQFQALRAVERLMPRIGKPDKERFADAIRERMDSKDGVVIDERDPSRLTKAKAVLGKLEAR